MAVGAFFCDLVFFAGILCVKGDESMKGSLIILRSVTYAQRAKRALEKAGISAFVIKPEPSLVGNGCGFAVKVSEINLPEAIDILNEQKFAVGKVYVSTSDGYREFKP